MNDGILEEISAEELKKNCRSSLKVVTDDGERASDVLRAQFPELNFTVKDGVLEISSEVKDASLLNKSLVGAGVGVYELTNEKIEFEDYFIGRLGK